jgi:hypothetical protein
MTDRFNTLTVVLDRDIREDDAEVLISAIKMIKGIIDVKGNVSSPETWMAEERAKSELRTKLYEILK